MELKKSKYGRKIKIQFWLSDWSGHEGILDYLSTFEGSQSDAGIAAFALLAQENGVSNAIAPDSRVTQDMRDLLANMRQVNQQIATRAKQLEEMQNLVMDLLKNARLSPEDSAVFSQRLANIQQMLVIEGAANYGGELHEIKEDESFGDW